MTLIFSLPPQKTIDETNPNQYYQIMVRNLVYCMEFINNKTFDNIFPMKIDNDNDNNPPPLIPEDLGEVEEEEKEVENLGEVEVENLGEVEEEEKG